jgi:hypothetical protein
MRDERGVFSHIVPFASSPVQRPVNSRNWVHYRVGSARTLFETKLTLVRRRVEL